MSYGWNAYWKNVGPLLLITIVIIAVQLVVNFIGSTRDGLTSSPYANYPGAYRIHGKGA